MCMKSSLRTFFVELIKNRSKKKQCWVNIPAECRLLVMLMLMLTGPWTAGWSYPGLKRRPGVTSSSYRPRLLFMSAVANDDEC